MSDLKFAMIFEVRGMDAAAAEMKRMREMTGASAALWAALGGLAGVLAGLAWVFGGLRRRPPRP